MSNLVTQELWGNKDHLRESGGNSAQLSLNCPIGMPGPGNPVWGVPLRRVKIINGSWGVGEHLMIYPQ